MPAESPRQIEIPKQMIEETDRLYHTKRSAGNALKKLPDETGEMSLLRKAIKKGEFEDQELSRISLEGLTRMETAINELLAQIKTMRDMLPLPERKNRLAVAQRLLFLRALLAIPLILMPFIDPEDELYFPYVTLKSFGVEIQLFLLLTAIQNQKSDLAKAK